ncbi:hypothetical protein FK531_09190 [Rhodococcus spelaei]|uniref:Uncharacterized protein n=1 Tax=Rhodococcus spelaei TaxID=2546320 RepID=A0A541BMT0_9NOCA|nr:hypothetical protein [Rhodococcus spelaei]TQF73635.1 hypothetical protein FK531_09190 [Rhodococcus spelaei]
MFTKKKIRIASAMIAVSGASAVALLVSPVAHASTPGPFTPQAGLGLCPFPSVLSMPFGLTANTAGTPTVTLTSSFGAVSLTGATVNWTDTALSQAGSASVHGQVATVTGSTFTMPGVVAGDTVTMQLSSGGSCWINGGVATVVV